MEHVKKIIGSQIVAARGLLDWSQDDLAGAAGLSALTVKRIEAVKREPLPRGKASASSDKIVAAIEGAGIEFTNGRSPGVRLKAKRG
jgi:transcriptional regulator with XRE-family HTH domain